METIKVSFGLLSTIPFVALLDYPIGTYIIWDSRSKKVPTYIGEGDVISRFREHRNRFAAPIDGYVALFNGTPKQAKERAVILEAVLLSIADETDRFPNANLADGKFKSLSRKFDRHGVVKIRCSGLDPFRHPENPKLLENGHDIRITLEEFFAFETFVTEHPWRTRR